MIDPDKEQPYVQYEPNLGTFEYGTAKWILGKPVKNKLGITFTMEAAQQKLAEYGIDFSRYDALVTGTKKAQLTPLKQ